MIYTVGIVADAVRLDDTRVEADTMREAAAKALNELGCIEAIYLRNVTGAGAGFQAVYHTECGGYRITVRQEDT